MSVTLHIFDLWQYYVCCTRSGVTRCTIFMVPKLVTRTCAVCAGAGYTLRCDRTSVHLCMRLLAAEPRSTAGLLFLCQYLCGTILVTPYSMVWDWRVSRAGPMRSHAEVFGKTLFHEFNIFNGHPESNSLSLQSAKICKHSDVQLNCFMCFITAWWQASYVCAEGLAGVMTFSLDEDDWAGGAFSIHSAIKQTLLSSSCSKGAGNTRHNASQSPSWKIRQHTHKKGAILKHLRREHVRNKRFS